MGSSCKAGPPAPVTSHGEGEKVAAEVLLAHQVPQGGATPTGTVLAMDENLAAFRAHAG